MASDRSLLRDALAQRQDAAVLSSSTEEPRRNIPAAEADEERPMPGPSLPDHEPAEDVHVKRKDPDTEEHASTDAKRMRHDDLEDEWAKFQRTVIAPANEAPVAHYEHATISAEPELNHVSSSDAPDDAEEARAEQRARLDRDAREEALARIEEEQRAQEEADERVRVLRARLARIKEARQRRTSHTSSQA
ncbi:hypothetical protein MNAN1_002926 [Malassezia nana]|uniref:Uncharacterized protein n=1 Tax=Malassezia nana TaxID=180528 RepID=A0AAF0ENV8_9BASI|nr:hypothetical protein MNAN1_002926 [Malassezia nana]